MLFRSRTGADYFDLAGTPLQKAPTTINFDPVSAGKGGYKHYMLKEIMDQPEAITDALRGRVSLVPANIELEGLPFSADQLRSLRRVVLLGMGTSYHSALLGRIYFEQLAGIPADVDNASEFRYRDGLLDQQTLVVSITQSGETADTLAAMEMAQAKGVQQVVITNTEGSQATRLADATVLIDRKSTRLNSSHT